MGVELKTVVDDKINPDFKDFLLSEGYSFPTYIRGKGVCAIMPFLFTDALVVDLNWEGYSDRYCYPKRSFYVAFTLGQWAGITSKGETVKGDPNDSEWIKRKGTKEYTNPKNKKNE